jgi:hypothetical protein
VDLDAVLPEEAGTVVWRVQAVTEAEEAPWSVAASFTSADAAADDAGQFLVNAPPVPIRPIEGDAVDPEGATLTWEGVPQASGYRVQVDTAETFDDPAIDLTLDQTTSLILFEELPDGEAPLYWRVRALFPNDTEGPWSETVQFGTDPTIEGRSGLTRRPRPTTRFAGRRSPPGRPGRLIPAAQWRSRLSGFCSSASC